MTAIEGFIEAIKEDESVSDGTVVAFVRRHHLPFSEAEIVDFVREEAFGVTDDLADESWD